MCNKKIIPHLLHIRPTNFLLELHIQLPTKRLKVSHPRIQAMHAYQARTESS